MKHAPAERLAQLIPPDAARALLAWATAARVGERIQVVLESTEGGGLIVTLPKRYAWHSEQGSPPVMG